MPRSARNLKTKVYLDLEQAFRQMVQNYMADKILALMIVAASPYICTIEFIRIYSDINYIP